MALSAEFGDIAVQPPLRLATYLEQKISMTNASIVDLENYVSALVERQTTDSNTKEELELAIYWRDREIMDLADLQRADILLSRGNPALGKVLLKLEIDDINHYANECFQKGALESTRSLLSDLNALREIRP